MHCQLLPLYSGHYYPAVSVLSPPFANQSDLAAFQAIQANLLRFAAEGSDLLLFVIFSPACLDVQETKATLWNVAASHVGTQQENRVNVQSLKPVNAKQLVH